MITENLYSLNLHLLILEIIYDSDRQFTVKELMDEILKRQGVDAGAVDKRILWNLRIRVFNHIKTLSATGRIKKTMELTKLKTRYMLISKNE